MAYTDPVTPDVVRRNGGNVITLAIEDENNLDNCYQRSAMSSADFTIRADTLSPDSIKKAIQDWVGSNPSIHNDLKPKTPSNSEDEQHRNAFKR